MRQRPLPHAPLLVILAACGPDGGRASDTAGLTAPATTGPASGTSSTTATSPTTTAPTTGDGGSTGEGSDTGSATAVATTGTTGTSTDDSGAPKLDVGHDTDDPGCAIDDLCCKMPGVIPPHALLDAFLAAYPPASMPKTVAAVQSFEPVADGHAMAWSDVNVGDELIDPTNGGVIEANIQDGRDFSRMAAEMVVPADATVLEIREDPLIIEDLGTPPPCLGVGWGWGSILFQGADESIGELVYLYIGLCSDGDVERFYYSDQSVEICPPPA